MSWTLAHNLQVRRDASKHCYPGLVVGEIGDQAHAAESGGSDHNPDARGIVHAIDVMLPVGPKATAVLNWCLTNPADLEYVIHNRLIYTVASHWKPLVYHGTDPHTNHVHISGRHLATKDGGVGENSHTDTGYSAAAEHMTPAGSPCSSNTNPSAPVEEDMPTAQEIAAAVVAIKLANGETLGGNISDTGNRVNVIYGRTAVLNGLGDAVKAAVIAALQTDAPGGTVTLAQVETALTAVLESATVTSTINAG